MKTNRIVGVTLALFIVMPFHAFGVTNQSLAVTGTNLVLSWPSLGYEYYMIQYWPNLQPETQWIQLTNCYPANSTNRTTFVIPCCELSALGGGSSSSMMMGGGDTGGGISATASLDLNDPSALWAIPADGQGSPTPLALYPNGYDTNNLFVAAKEVVMSRIRKTIRARREETITNSSASIESFGGGSSGPMNLTSGGCDCPDMGFFRVWHIPDWAFNVTNYTFGGPTFFPVDFKDYLDRVENIEVLLNGEPSPYAEFTSSVSGGETNWGMGIYFDRLTNGMYQIQLRTTIGLNEETGDNAVSLVLSNLTRSIAVFNQVTYPDWNDFIQGDTYTFKAQTANPDTDWSIDIYDASENYVNSGSGHTTNGLVSWTWDLNDWQANNRDDFDSDPYFFSQVTFSSAGNGPTITKPTPIPVKGYPNRGKWLISFQDRWYSDSSGLYVYLQSYYEAAMNAIQGGPPLVGDEAIQIALKLGTNVYSQAQREQSWTNLRAWIGDLSVRNFYYNGHGGATSIGCDKHIYGTDGGPIGGEFTHRGSKSQLQNWQIAKNTKYNRYRFVFLDGCRSATGDMPNAFNISKTNHTISFYENHPKHPRPSVFVGWNQEVGGEGWGTAVKQHKFQEFWMGNWANSFPPRSIEDALKLANVSADWVSEAKLLSALTIYGYKGMTIREYNNKNDWRWP